MGNRRYDRRERKRQKRIVSLTAPPQTLIDLEADQAEISLFLSLTRFNSLIRDIKRSIYRRPQQVFKRPNYDNRIAR